MSTSPSRLPRGSSWGIRLCRPGNSSEPGRGALPAPGSRSWGGRGWGDPSQLGLNAKFCLQPPRLLPRVPGSTFGSSPSAPSPQPHPSRSEIDESMSRSERRAARASRGRQPRLPGSPGSAGSRTRPRGSVREQCASRWGAPLPRPPRRVGWGVPRAPRGGRADLPAGAPRFRGAGGARRGESARPAPPPGRAGEEAGADGSNYGGTAPARSPRPEDRLRALSRAGEERRGWRGPSFPREPGAEIPLGKARPRSPIPLPPPLPAFSEARAPTSPAPVGLQAGPVVRAGAGELDGRTGCYLNGAGGGEEWRVQSQPWASAGADSLCSAGRRSRFSHKGPQEQARAAPG